MVFFYATLIRLRWAVQLKVILSCIRPQAGGIAQRGFVGIRGGLPVARPMAHNVFGLGEVAFVRWLVCRKAILPNPCYAFGRYLKTN